MDPPAKPNLGTSQDIGGDISLSLFDDLPPLGDLTGTDSEFDTSDLLGSSEHIDFDTVKVPEATWLPEELRILHECLLKYPENAFTALNRYVKISQHLPGKTIRDIGQKVKALRGDAPVGQDPKRKLTESDPHRSAKRSREASGDYATDAALFEEQEAEVNRVLEETERLVQTIRENLVKEDTAPNSELMSRFSQLVQGVLARINSMPGVMSQLPPLPVKFNTYFLPTQGLRQLAPSNSHT